MADSERVRGLSDEKTDRHTEICDSTIVNNTLHELYFGRVVIFWIKYNEAPAELYLIQNITTWSKYNECTYYLF